MSKDDESTGSGSTDPAVWPAEIRLAADKRLLTVMFEGGEAVELPAELLRVESPSAEVQGHHASEKRLVGGKRQVRITDIAAVGNYAVRLRFDDGHSTGIYGWPYLLELGRRMPEIMDDYASRLTAAGLSREPPGR